MVAVIVPAHNEAETIGGVLEAVRGAVGVSDLIVVCDSCTDSTEEIAGQYASVVMSIDARNKGTAMAAGLEQVIDETVAFIDADLEGLLPEHVTYLLNAPPERGQLVALRDNHADAIAGLPPISGERRLPTWVAREADLAGLGWSAELQLDATVGRLHLPWRHFVMKGVRNPSKYRAVQKIDLLAAAVRRAPGLALYTTRPDG